MLVRHSLVLLVRLLQVTMRRGRLMSFQQAVQQDLLRVYRQIIFSGVAVLLLWQKLIWLKWPMIFSSLPKRRA
jgi:hypothetical protein